MRKHGLRQVNKLNNVSTRILTRIQQQHFAKEDSYIHSQYVFFYPLEKIIGEDYVKMIQKDEKSMNYATYQFKKFRTEVGNVEPLEPKACQILRTQAKEDLDVVKGQYVNGMVDETKNDDGTLKKQVMVLPPIRTNSSLILSNGVLLFFSNFSLFSIKTTA